MVSWREWIRTLGRRRVVEGSIQGRRDGEWGMRNGDAQEEGLGMFEKGGVLLAAKDGAGFLARKERFYQRMKEGCCHASQS